nr:immunoglobulin light chain junction region [Macaca mulatta]
DYYCQVYNSRANVLF